MKYMENVFMTLLWDVCNVIGFATILLSSGINHRYYRSSKITKNASGTHVHCKLENSSACLLKAS
jgi:hypothetical protein